VKRLSGTSLEKPGGGFHHNARVVPDAQYQRAQGSRDDLRCRRERTRLLEEGIHLSKHTRERMGSRRVFLGAIGLCQCHMDYLQLYYTVN